VSSGWQTSWGISFLFHRRDGETVQLPNQTKMFYVWKQKRFNQVWGNGKCIGRHRSTLKIEIVFYMYMYLRRREQGVHYFRSSDSSCVIMLIIHNDVFKRVQLHWLIFWVHWGSPWHMSKTTCRSVLGLPSVCSVTRNIGPALAIRPDTQAIFTSVASFNVVTARALAHAWYQCGQK
jgi:hypothetical protein